METRKKIDAIIIILYIIIIYQVYCTRGKFRKRRNGVIILYMCNTIYYCIPEKCYFLEISFQRGAPRRVLRRENGVYFEVFVDSTKLQSFRQTAL